MEEQDKKQIGQEPADTTLPHQIDAPERAEANEELEKPFVNEYGVVIGDSFYDSPASPLNRWSKDVDPAIMAGDQWVHPTNDIGWNTPENQELLEEGYIPQSGRFMHPSKDVSYRKD
ncbi:DUF3905 domain-containing protein [Aneurinibacillus sp. REN35]|uniref:DUF3905 domain-containing protein n=1 Tax=Aneurinibacillus sp. REN35 TaxID=3237286 RepID=UPI00352750FD